MPIKLLLSIFLFSLSVSVFSQENPEDIIVDSDEFQNNFYESIKQKAIQNYDKAIESLEKCLKLQPSNPVIYNELGINNLNLKKYKDAYDSFEKAYKIDAKNIWYLHGMYDVCYKTQDFTQSIVLVKELIKFDKNYREDLTSLYMKTQQYDKALEMINELNATVGKSDKRELYKAQILQSPKNQLAEINNLKELIKKNPKDETNYQALLRLYYKNNMEKEAKELTAKIEEEFPNSDNSQVSLFKKYLDANDSPNVVSTMHKIISSNEVDNKIKHRVFNEFLVFANNNPTYDADIEKAVGYLKSDTSVKVAREVAKFYQSKQKWASAIKFYLIDLKNNPNDKEVLKLLMDCYQNNQQYDALCKTAESFMETFPQDPNGYGFAGSGYNQLKNFKKAKDVLETGLDVIVEDNNMLYNFYEQLKISYEGLGDVAKKNNCIEQMKKIKKS